MPVVAGDDVPLALALPLPFLLLDADADADAPGASLLEWYRFCSSCVARRVLLRPRLPVALSVDHSAAPGEDASVVGVEGECLCGP